MQENHEAEFVQQYELKGVIIKQQLARAILQIEHLNKIIKGIENSYTSEDQKEERMKQLSKLERKASKLQKEREEEKKKNQSERASGIANLSKQCKEEIENLLSDFEIRLSDIDKEFSTKLNIFVASEKQNVNKIKPL
eukprot:TRINITY_DN9943_c0_g2_i1.p1 TRINITY_DN9943_c0_g2~~TRINITY_DN9943_c0_g2_i1.p1  ORF type:complete len:138 (+),score=29.32 TRINITY_DN9943_c0_g2_i1:113-526(+)